MNKLEKYIIDEICDFNKKQFPLLKKHFSLVRVKSREFTGIGSFTTFEYFTDWKERITDKDHLVLSSDRHLEMSGLEYGLTYELNITNGKIDMLELVANGEVWNGEFQEFEFKNMEYPKPRRKKMFQMMKEKWFK